MRVEIKELEFKCIIGILKEERVKKQRVLIDVSFDYTYDKKERDFVDYAEVAKTIEKIMKKEKFFLIEEALLKLKKDLKEKFFIENLSLNITKPDILHNCRVSVAL